MSLSFSDSNSPNSPHIEEAAEVSPAVVEAEVAAVVGSG